MQRPVDGLRVDFIRWGTFRVDATDQQAPDASERYERVQNSVSQEPGASISWPFISKRHTNIKTESTTRGAENCRVSRRLR